MRPDLIFVFLAGAQTGTMPPEPPLVEMIRPPYFSCGVDRTGPIGTVEAHQFVFPNGRRNERIYSWAARRDPAGIELRLVWGDDGPADDDIVYIEYSPLAPDDVYRLRVQRSEPGPSDDLQLQSGLRGAADGRIFLFSTRRILAGVLAGAPEARLVVLSAEGDVLRSDPIDPAGFDRSLEIAAALRPELDMLVADYRNACEFVESLDFVP